MEDKQDEKFIQGFNEGFLIAASLPELAKQLSNTEMNDDRGLGLKEGIAQYERDRGIEKQRKSPLTKDSSEPSKEKDIDHER